MSIFFHWLLGTGVTFLIIAIFYYSFVFLKPKKSDDAPVLTFESGLKKTIKKNKVYHNDEKKYFERMQWRNNNPHSKPS